MIIHKYLIYIPRCGAHSIVFLFLPIVKSYFTFVSVCILFISSGVGESTGDKSEPGEYSAQSIQVSFKLLKVRVSGWALYNCLIRKWSIISLCLIFRRLNVLLLENEFESHNDIDTARYEVFSYLTS